MSLTIYILIGVLAVAVAVLAIKYIYLRGMVNELIEITGRHQTILELNKKAIRSALDSLQIQRESIAGNKETIVFLGAILGKLVDVKK